MPPAARRTAPGPSTGTASLAAQGRVDEALLAELLAEPYLHLPPPKTTGRELFGAQFGAAFGSGPTAAGLAPADIVATLTAFTARSIGQAYRDFLPGLPDEVIVSGGGARNPTLMAMLREALAPARVLTSAEFGLPVEAKEAVAFAVLAYETWHGRPGNLPAATGARHPVVLGSITPGVQSAISHRLCRRRTIRQKTKDRRPQAICHLPLSRLIHPHHRGAQSRDHWISTPCPRSTWCG